MSETLVQDRTSASGGLGASSMPRPGTGPAAPGGTGRADSGLSLDAVMTIPVTVQVVLGSTTMPVSELMKLSRGAILPLDHRVGEPVDVVVNGRVVARGELVVMDDDNSRFGVSLTEVVASGAARAPS